MWKKGAVCFNLTCINWSCKVHHVSDRDAMHVAWEYICLYIDGIPAVNAVQKWIAEKCMWHVQIISDFFTLFSTAVFFSYKSWTMLDKWKTSSISNPQTWSTRTLIMRQCNLIFSAPKTNCLTSPPLVFQLSHTQ